MMLGMGWICLVPGLAFAAEGPWTTPTGLQDIYLGGGVERFQAFDKGDGSVQDVSYPVYRSGGKIFWRYGLGPMWDVALDAPFITSFAPEAPADSEAFSRTTDFEYLKTRVRVRLPVDNLPFEVAARGEVRTGYLHQDTKGRVTNLGEGTTDLGASVSVGSIGLFGGMFYTLAVDGGYLYRLPLESGDSGKVPGNEVLLSSFLQVSPLEHMGFAILTDSFWRLSGEDFGETEVKASANTWAALKAAQTKVGGQVILYPGGARPQVVLTVARAVWARNNPVDTMVVELGMSFNLGSRR